jgi:hypothetical protein
MNLRLLLTFAFFTTIFTAYAQVGIGNISPSDASLLHVDDASGEKGILIPKVQIDNLNNQDPVTGTIVEGLLVYNNAGLNPHGFYFWDGASWVLFTTSQSDETIYSTDGSLPETRTVSTGDNSLEILNDLSSAQAAGRNALILKRGTNSKEVGLAFRNSGNFYDASISLQENTSSGLSFATGGNHDDPDDIVVSMTIEDDGQLTLPRYTGTTHQSATAQRVLGVDNAGNVIAVPEERYTAGFARRFEQDATLRTPDVDTYYTIPNLTQTITAPYTGTYEIDVNAYYAVGAPNVTTTINVQGSSASPNQGSISYNENSAGQGSVQLLMDGVVQAERYMSSTGHYFQDGTRYFAQAQSSTTTILVDLVAGSDYTFSVRAREWVRYNTSDSGYIGLDSSVYIGNSGGRSDASRAVMTIKLVELEQ